MSARLGDVAFDFLLSDEELEALAREKPADEEAGRNDDKGQADESPAAEDGPERRIPADSGGGGGLGMILLFLILAAAAFAAGMAVRFQKETGGSLIDAIRSKSAKVVAPAKAKSEAPAPAGDAPSQ